MEKLKSVAQLGAKLKKFRKSQNVTQQELADLAGVSRKAISELERGKETLRMDIALKVLSVSDIKLMLEDSGDE